MSTEGASSAGTSSRDVVAKLENLARRLDWDSKNDWLASQPDWLQQLVLSRDPADNGANVLLMAEGLRASVLAGDPAGELVAQLLLLRSVEVPPDSVVFTELRNAAARLGDRHVEGLLAVLQARTLIFHRASPSEVMAQIETAVAVAGLVQDWYLDTLVGDLVGTYAVMVGAPSAARRAFEFTFREKANGSYDWILGQLNLASVEISIGDLGEARKRHALLTPYLENASEPAKNFAEWVRILGAERLGVIDHARLSTRESLVVRKRAIRRFLFFDLFGIVPVEQCIEEILAGVPTDPATGLASVTTLRAFLDESVAIGRETQLASVGLPQLLNAASRLDEQAASALVDAVGQRFAPSHDGRLVIARLDLDRYAVFGDLAAAEFNRLLQELLHALQEPIALVGEEPMRLRPLARMTVSAPGDTGYSVWERVFSVPRGESPGAPIQVTAPDSIESERRYRLVQELLADAMNDHAQVEFQPIVDVDAQVVRGFEALLRWESPDLGRLPPPMVVEAAERCGAIAKLERHIVTTAISGASVFRTVDPQCRVNVNLTAEQLADEAMARHLIDECARLDVAPAAIGVELTESALIDHAAAVGSLDLLAEHGFSIALDDFGTGYSNLAYLVEMRNVGLKIDGSFVRRMLEDQRADTVCRMLVSAAETLGAPIVAEQVETDAQVAALRGLGCVLHQGYRFSPALPLERAAELLANPTSFWTWPT